MSPFEQKRNQFLRTLETSYTPYAAFYSILGPGIWKKVRRAWAHPGMYMAFMLWRVGLLPRKNKKIKLFWGRTIRADIVDIDIATLYLSGSLCHNYAEHKLTKFLLKRFVSGDILYDIGANYGFYSYLAMEFCEAVHVFEPLPAIFENLNMNMRDDTNVTLNNTAVTDTKGEVPMYISNASGISSINKDFIDARERVQKAVYTKKGSVSAITLDEYTQTHRSPTIIKIDVEGAESSVISGAREFLRHHSPVVIMEVHAENEDGGLSLVAVAEIRNLGYQSYRIDTEGDLQKIDGDLPSSIGPELGFSSDNFVFIRI